MKKGMLILGCSCVILMITALAASGPGTKSTSQQTNSQQIPSSSANANSQPMGSGITQWGAQMRTSTALPNLSDEMKNALSTSHGGLVEEAIPSGGYKLDLKGRFQSVSVLTVNETGEPTVNCIQGLPEEASESHPKGHDSVDQSCKEHQR